MCPAFRASTLPKPVAVYGRLALLPSVDEGASMAFARCFGVWIRYLYARILGASTGCWQTQKASETVPQLESVLMPSVVENVEMPEWSNALIFLSIFDLCCDSYSTASSERVCIKRFKGTRRRALLHRLMC